MDTYQRPNRFNTLNLMVLLIASSGHIQTCEINGSQADISYTEISEKYMKIERAILQFYQDMDTEDIVEALLPWLRVTETSQRASSLMILCGVRGLQKEGQAIESKVLQMNVYAEIRHRRLRDVIERIIECNPDYVFINSQLIDTSKRYFRHIDDLYITDSWPMTYYQAIDKIDCDTKLVDYLSCLQLPEPATAVDILILEQAASILWKLTANNKAKAIIERAISIADTRKDTLKSVSTRVHAAAFAIANNDNDLAERLLLQAESIASEIMLDIPQRTVALQRGVIAVKRANLQTAIHLFEYAAGNIDMPVSHYFIADAMTNAGYVCDELANFQGAQEWYERAERFYEYIGDKQSQNIVALNIGALLERQGLWDQAREKYRLVIELSTENRQKDLKVVALVNTANTYAYQRHFHQALNKMMLAADLRREKSIQDDDIWFQYNMANLYLQMNDTASAIPYIRNLKQLQPDSTEYYLKQRMEAELYFLDKKYRNAISLADESIQDLQEQGWKTLLWDFHYIKGKALKAQKKYSQAIVEFESALLVIEEMSKQCIDAFASIQFTDSCRHVIELLMEALYATIEEGIYDQQHVSDLAMQYISRYRRQVLRRYILGEANKYDTIESQPEVHDSVAVESGTVLQYFFGSKNAYLNAFVSGKGNLYRLNQYDHLSRMLNVFCQQLQRSVLDIQELQAISKLLLPIDIVQEIRKSGSLNICADNILHHFPFDLIQHTSSDNYLGLEVPVTYIACMRTPAKKRLTARHLQTYMGVYQSNDGLNSMEPLKWTRNEILSGSSWFCPTQVITLLDTDLNSYIEMINDTSISVDVLHMAGHTVFHPHDPFQTALFSFNQNEGSAFSIADSFHQSVKPRLCFINSCSSAYGQVFYGEGSISLAYSLLIAGGQYVVTTLWPIEDRVGFEFANVFFRHLMSAGGTPDEALFLAKQEISLRPPFHTPYRWAGFVVIQYPLHIQAGHEDSPTHTAELIKIFVLFASSLLLMMLLRYTISIFR